MCPLCSHMCFWSICSVQMLRTVATGGSWRNWFEAVFVLSLTRVSDCCCMQVTGTRQGLVGVQHSQYFVPPLFTSLSDHSWEEDVLERLRRHWKQRVNISWHTVCCYMQAVCSPCAHPHPGFQTPAHFWEGLAWEWVTSPHFSSLPLKVSRLASLENYWILEHLNVSSPSLTNLSTAFTGSLDE